MMILSEEMQKQAQAIRNALDGLVSKIVESPAEINNNMVAIRRWRPGVFVAGDVRMYYGVPYRCVQAHDSTIVTDWTPEDAPALWMQYHGTTVDTARPWLAPAGAHDMYKVGEYMIFTDDHTYLCKVDTVYSPTDLPSAWEQVI